MNEINELDCKWLTITGIFCIGLLVLSVLFNTLVLKVFIFQKKKKFSYEYLIMTLAVLNLIGSLAHLPIFIYNQFACKFVFRFIHSILMGFFYCKLNCYWFWFKEPCLDTSLAISRRLSCTLCPAQTFIWL